MTEHIDTIVIGGGQAGLSAGYQLRASGVPFLILDSSERIGDSWRTRWDSLRLFTPARYSSLDGMPFPGPPGYYPTKDEMADYLGAYAEHFELPVRLRTTVTRLSRGRADFLVETDKRSYRAHNVVVAMGHYQRPNIPAFAGLLDDRVVQVHSSEYRRPSDLDEGDVLVVGAANSGVEIALDLARDRRVLLSGDHPGNVPFDIEGFWGRKVLIRLVLGGLFHHVLTIDNPLGRKAKHKLLSKGGLLIRSKPEDVEAAGIERVPRVTSVENGHPVLEDGRHLETPNVIWATGYHSALSSWIDLDVLADDEPIQHRGVVEEVPGLYFIGLAFLYTPTSGMFKGLARDSRRVVEHIVTNRAPETAALTPG